MHIDSEIIRRNDDIYINTHTQDRLQFDRRDSGAPEDDVRLCYVLITGAELAPAFQQYDLVPWTLVV